MDPRVLATLKLAGFDIFSFANNHIGDWGLEAFEDTLHWLNENEFKYTGAGFNKNEAKEPAIIERNGLKIGFIGFSDVGPKWMEAKDDKAGILLAGDLEFEKIIAEASKKADILIVSFHFGEEYKKHTKRQEELAHKAIDSGARIVIGHHPHVAQDVEEYKNGLIAYSLGNFIFDQSFSKETMQGLVLKIKVGQEGILETQKYISKLNKFFQPQELIALEPSLPPPPKVLTKKK
jgi:poly-gamma-glutamate synthesis protein (capsule biosynthesis protein)